MLIENDEKTMVFCGEACYQGDSLKKQIIPGIYYDKSQSEAFIKEYSKDKYISIFSHDKIFDSPNGVILIWTKKLPD